MKGKRVSIAAACLCFGMCVLQGCVYFLFQQEFYECAWVDWSIREVIEPPVRPGMSEREFVDAHEARGDPRSTLTGPVTERLSPSRWFPSPDEGWREVCLDPGEYGVYIVSDPSGCPLHRFFFSRSGELVWADSLSQEFGVFGYSAAQKWGSTVSPQIAARGCNG